MKIDYNKLNEKIKEYENLSIAEKYSFSDKLFKMILVADPEKVKEILFKDPFFSFYKKAQMEVLKEISLYNLQISHHNRQMFFIYKEESKNFASDFFEICDFTEKFGDSLLEKIILLGFFMQEDRMIIIQTFDSLTKEVSLYIKS